MRIRFLQNVITGGKTYKPGDEAEFEEKNARPLIAAGAAVQVDAELAFASEAARELAEEHGLGPADFAGLSPSGKSGFTVKDVEGLLDEED
jgi:hypothetical protein